MAVKVLGCGAMVLLDAEDYELVEKRSWHVYKLRPSKKPAVAACETRYGRMFRLMLHREVILRAYPNLIKRKFRVYPKNGNYLDCRRENLDVVAKKRTRGHPGIEPRPTGWKRMDVSGKRKSPEASPSWAGGYEYIQKWPTGPNFGRKLRCISGKPVD